MSHLLAILLVLSGAGHHAGPSTRQALHSRYANHLVCDFDWHTVRGNARLVACEAGLRRLPVARVVCVAHRESGFHAGEVYGRAYGTFQHILTFWRGRFLDYAARWGFHPKVLNGRTNAFVSVAMMASLGINRALGPGGPWYSPRHPC